MALTGASMRQAAAGEPRKIYSQDYWDIVLGQMRRRPAVMLSLVVLVLMYAVAIYAPLIANDRPLYFRGIDGVSYEKARREIVLAAESLRQAAEEDRDVAQDIASVRARIATMRRQLVASDQEPLDDLSAALDDMRGARGPTERVRAAGRVVEMAEVARARMAPAGVARNDTDDAPAGTARDSADVAPTRGARNGATPAGGGVTLVPYTAYPVFENLGRGEIFFMVLMALILTMPAWNRIVNRFVLGGDRLRIRHSRRIKALAFAAIPVLAAGLWQGEQAAFFASPHKAGLTNGDVTAETVVFPPIPYGLAEINNSENFRPPTWHIESVITEDGYYKYGPRAGRIDQATRLPKPPNPVEQRHAEPAPNATWRHFLGTDSLGRDLLARIIWGGRVSLAVGLISTVLLVFIGIIVGSLAGYYGGWIDIIISRVIEIVQSFPVFFLILIVVAFIGPSIINIMLAIGFFRWTGVARLVRGEFIRLRSQDFVVASRALGVQSARTIFRHVLPNALGPVLVHATFSVAAGILTESGLSFLGFGIQLPIPSWGALLIESRSAEHWWIQIYPGLLVFVTVLLYNLLGEGVRDALDPKLKTA